MADYLERVSQPGTNLRSSRSILSHLHFFPRLRESFARPTDALPLDLFRIMVGMVVFAYFLHTFFQAKDFSDPEGLIDHELSLELFWFTRLGLFQPGMSLWAFQAIFLFACICAVALIVGYRVKIVALLLYLIAVSTYRWNFLVMYVDDSIIHLLLFWLLLLPVGRTLVLSEWRVDRERAWQRWLHEKVPGTAVRCFLWNLALIYLVAGLWKWTSPMWREGTALYAVFKLPISLAPDFWGPQHLQLLMLLNYSALVLEPLFPLIFVLRKRHPAKYLLFLALVAFHVGTLVTLQIPYANLACIASMIIPFGGELMDRLRKGDRRLQTPQIPMRPARSGAVAVLFVSCLTLAMISSVVLPEWRAPSRDYYASALGPQTAPVEERAVVSADDCCAPRELEKIDAEGLRPIQKTFFSLLWSIGVAQQYQLFNWIDERNYSVNYRVFEYEGPDRATPTREIEPSAIFSSSTRGVLLRFYLHGITWMKIPPQRHVELRRSIQVRAARRYCQNYEPAGDVAVYSTVERIVPGNNQGAESPVLLIRFSCQEGEPRMEAMNPEP